MIREVAISFRIDSWVVRYCGRRKGQRYYAACFYAKDHSLESVENWVKKQPQLRLISSLTSEMTAEWTSHRDTGTVGGD